MPASIVHMLIAREVIKRIKTDASLNSIHFIANLSENEESSINLGALGPDLPYYESMAKGAVDLLFKRSDKPMGVDQWSYQMHSKDPNVFPLKMIEIIWKESSMEKKDWDKFDHQKFAFVCGYLTHMAADQIIHPLVNLIAGQYYKRGDAREKHRECEVYQDVFAYKQIIKDKDFRDGDFHTWCDVNRGLGDNAPTWLRYLLQKAFVEAHAVMPLEENIEDWVDGILTILRLIDNVGPYAKAYEALKKDSSEKKSEYIDLILPGNSTDDKRTEYQKIVGSKKYMEFFNEAVELAYVYVKAALKIYDSEELDDEVRKKFKDVVINADLSAPLDRDILEHANLSLTTW